MEYGDDVQRVVVGGGQGYVEISAEELGYYREDEPPPPEPQLVDPREGYAGAERGGSEEPDTEPGEETAEERPVYQLYPDQAPPEPEVGPEPAAVPKEGMDLLAKLQWAGALATLAWAGWKLWRAYKD